MELTEHFKKKEMREEGRRLLIALFGAAVYSAGVNLFIVPAGLYSGGMMGFAQVIRTVLVCRGGRQANTLHKRASSYVKASAQAAMIEKLQEDLTEEELQVYKRGRNAKTVSMAKHATMHDYRHATGFEALMGYLYLTGQMARMIDLIKLGIEKTGGTL